MKNRRVLNSPRLLKFKKEKQKTFRKKLLWAVFFLVLFFLSLIFLSRWKEMNIENVQVSGNKVLETKIIEQKVREKISGNYFWVFPKTNFIIYPQKEIATDLKNNLKRIKDVFVNDRNIKNLEINITEYNAEYLWCGISPVEKKEVAEEDFLEKNKCYFMNEDGYIFDEAPYFSGEVYFKFYGNNALNLENPLGTYFFEKDFNRFIYLKKSIEELGIKITSLFVMDNGDVKILLSPKIINQKNPEIIMKLDSDFTKAIENLQSILNTEPLQTDFKNKYSSLLYIDLRFGNKVFYKFK